MSLNINQFPKQKHALIEAILKFRNASEFARKLGVSRQLIEGWIRAYKIAPPIKYCKKIEEITNGDITREQLRPDVYGEINRQKTTDNEKLETCMQLLNSVAKSIAEKRNKDK